jgi:phosphoribosylaminoimidazolecarboxamide formyltransferase/IMP cyclohydrolase
MSVTDKTGIVELASALAGQGVEIISTGGTFRVLKDAGISSLREVADVTEFPEMLDGRVKTIHPRIAGGILAVRSKPEHVEAVTAHSIPMIDLVVVNLYQFEKVAADPNAPLEELIEHIDIGGPTLIRAAAKNWQDVAIVTSPDDYVAIIAELSANGGSLSRETHWRLATKAFAATAAYDRAISRRLAPDDNLDVLAPLRFTLRYGENPHQTAALYATGDAGIAGAEQLQGKELSFNNLVDLDAAWQLAQEFEHPASAIIKHTNPCGCAESSTLVESYRRAFEADPISPFGGVLAFNRNVDAETAEEIVKILMDAVAAPDYSAAALNILAARKNLRLLRVKTAPPSLVIKSISGGYLAESPDTGAWSRETAQVKTRRAPTEAEWKGLAFAMKVAKHVKSNAIIFARAGQTIGIGAGQTSRVDSVKVGAMRAILPLQGSVLASDAFFPFPDGVEEAAKHGITAIIQPGGSVKDNVVIETADRLGLAMVFTGIRHFRH